MSRLAEKYRVIYFVKDLVPSEAERADAVKFGPHCTFRTTVAMDATNIESCAAVAGAVPAHYAAVYPTAMPWAEWLKGGMPSPSAPPPVFAPAAVPPPSSAPIPGKKAGWSRNAG